eukprot:778062_1
MCDEMDAGFSSYSSLHAFPSPKTVGQFERSESVSSVYSRDSPSVHSPRNINSIEVYDFRQRSISCPVQYAVSPQDRRPCPRQFSLPNASSHQCPSVVTPPKFISDQIQPEISDLQSNPSRHSVPSFNSDQCQVMQPQFISDQIQPEISDLQSNPSRHSVPSFNSDQCQVMQPHSDSHIVQIKVELYSDSQ